MMVLRLFNNHLARAFWARHSPEGIRVPPPPHHNVFVIGRIMMKLSKLNKCYNSPVIILDQPRTNCNKRFFADFKSTGQLEHHIKNVSKSTFGKLQKIVVLKHRVLHLHGNEARNKLLSFRPTYNKNITEKLSTHITEVFNKQYLQFQSNISCNFAKNKIFEKIQDGGQNGGQDGGHFVERLLPKQCFLIKT